MFRLNPIGSSSSSSSAYGEFVADASAGALATIVGDAVQTPVGYGETEDLQMQLGGNCPSEVKAMSGEGIGGGGSSSSRISMNSISSSSSNTTAPPATRKFKSAFVALRTIVRNEGAHVLYRSYPTTLIMNVPFTAIHVGLYESAKRALKIEEERRGFSNAIFSRRFRGRHRRVFDHADGRRQDSNANALRGSLGVRREQNRGNGDCEPNVRRSRRSKVVRFNNNIFDADADCASTIVVSKRLRVRQRVQSRRHVAEREGAKALFSGATARVLFHVPAAAICWTAYEFMKRNLGIEVDPSSHALTN